MADNDVVEVIDMTLVTSTPGLTLQYTIRAHEGDTFTEGVSGGGGLFLRVVYGPHAVWVNGAKRTLPGKTVSIQGVHIVEATSMIRLEPRVRPSAALLVNRERAELEALKQQHGVADTP